MKKVFALLFTAAILTLSLTACGKQNDESSAATAATRDESSAVIEATTTSSISTAEGQNETNDNADEDTQNTAQASEGLSSHEGAYTDGTNYLVIAGGEITLNGHKCEVTTIQTDHFKSGVPVFYFTYEENEISIYYDDVCGMNCSLGQSDGSWLTYEAIDIAEVPHFDVEDEQVADTTSEASAAPQAEKYPFVGVTYKHESLDFTFQLKTPDADGYPTEVLLNGSTYGGSTYDNETCALSDVTIKVSDDSIYLVQASFYSGEQSYAFCIEGTNEIWRMRAPYEGDCYPK